MVLCLYNSFDDGVIRMRIEITNRWTDSIKVDFCEGVKSSATLKNPVKK